MTIFAFPHAVRALALGAALIVSQAAPAQAEFMGGGYLSDFSGCEVAGWPVNTEMVRARYSAKEIDGGPSELVLNFAVGGVNAYQLNRPLLPRPVFSPAVGRVIWGTQGTMSPRPQIRVLERETVPFIGGSFATATDIRLRVRIRHFNGVRGCMATATLMLHRWN